jgi:hypothetical protein
MSRLYNELWFLWICKVYVKTFFQLVCRTTKKDLKNYSECYVIDTLFITVVLDGDDIISAPVNFACYLASASVLICVHSYVCV